MEIKKTEKADLENRRTTRLLVGLVVSLSVFLLALEYTEEVDEQFAAENAEVVDEWNEDLQAITIDNDFVAVAPDVQASVFDKLKIQDEAVKQAEMAAEIDSLKDLAAKAFVAQFEEEDFLAIDPPEATDDGQNVFRVVQDMPQFPGGMSEYIKWLTKNLRYPYLSRKNKTEGKVMARFIVNADGTISDIKIVKSLDVYCDREALRVLRLMPKWKAGVQNDMPCRTQVCLPIVFKM